MFKKSETLLVSATKSAKATCQTVDKSGHFQKACNVSSGSRLQREHVVSVDILQRARLTLVEENEVAEVSAPDKRVQNVGGSGTRKKKPRVVGPMDAFVTPPPKTTQMGRSEGEIQATANDAYKKELREKACADIARLNGFRIEWVFLDDGGWVMMMVTRVWSDRWL
ncbi:hypothetical protein CMV_021102 [Castanea mollissima]|uniref:Uncharacterized protein n=1 Tax=Castanea mollissima TaxID=60419 RepID=A0A8J4VM01_9ROSI|nr:hypothetical protein CMV_021102 [Castanea mollissima]